MSNELALRQYTLPLPKPFEASESLQDFGTPEPGAHHGESWPVLYILTNSKEDGIHWPNYQLSTPHEATCRKR